MIRGREVGRLTAALLALALLAAACTGGDDPVAPPTGDDQAAVDGDADDDDAPADDDADALAPDGAGVLSDVQQAAVEWLLAEHGLSAAVVDGLEPAGVTSSPGVQHVRFVQTVGGHDVIGAEITVHVLDDGTVQTVTDDLVLDVTAGEDQPSVSQADAVETATKAVTGTVEGSPAAELAWLRDGMTLTLAWQVELATVEPTSSWVVTIDAATGQVLLADQADFGLDHVHAPSRPGDAAAARMAREPWAKAGAVLGQHLALAALVAQAEGEACPAPSPGACVFLPDPIYAAGGTLTDRGRANDFLTAVPLQGLDRPDTLIGDFVNTEPPGASGAVREQDGTWATGRAGRGFEAAMAYYWIDRVQRQIQRLGFTGVLDNPFDVVPVDADLVDNAFYSPAERVIHLGVGSDGINEGEDASGIIHEYGHAVLDAQAPGLIGSAEAGAYHESFGDLLAFLTTLPLREGDAACLFAWAEEGACLRRIDSPKVYPRDLRREVHEDGEIYNGAIYDVTSALLAQQGLSIEECPGTGDCDAVLDRVLTTLLSSNSYLSNDPTLPDVAAAFLLANEAIEGGADAELLREAFAAHGLAAGGAATGGSPEGQSGEDGAGGAVVVGDDGIGVGVRLEVTHTYRGDLDVQVGVVGADLEPLCTPVTLFTPDADDGEDNLIGSFDLDGTDCASFAPPAADRIWYLQVTDTLAEDEGQITFFILTVDGVPYRAAGLPLPIGDADPDGTFAVVDGSAGGGDGAGPGQPSGVGGTMSAGAPVLAVEISHSYVGDLALTAGVVDASSEVQCVVQVLEPDPSDAGDSGVSGEIDMGKCAAFYPPTPSQRWYLLAIDTAALDEGSITQMALRGPDGAEFSYDDLPVVIPDDDVDGVALLLDGSGGAPGQAGGGGTGVGATADVALTHPYRGDLAVSVGVLSGDEVICEVPLATPDPEDPGTDLVLEGVSVADCGRHYPPTPDRPWFVFAADTLALDTGVLESFTLTGPDGTVHAASGLPVPLPDADPDGVLVLLQGQPAGDPGAPASDEVRGRVTIRHPYVGDLRVVAGVEGQGGADRCEVVVREADPADASENLSLQFSFGPCGDRYPPGEGVRFFVSVTDLAEADVGQVEAFQVVGSDGRVFSAFGVPAPVPDASAEGVVVGVGG